MMPLPLAILAIESESDRAFMTDLYLTHRALMLKIAWKYTGVSAEVDDLVSDSVVALIQHIDSLKEMPDLALRAYIASTVRNKALDLLRKKKREQGWTVEGDMDRVPDPGSFEHKISVQAEVDSVRQALEFLPDHEREALRLKFFEKKTNPEIAQALNVAESVRPAALYQAPDVWTGVHYPAFLPQGAAVDTVSTRKTRVRLSTPEGAGIDFAESEEPFPAPEAGETAPVFLHGVLPASQTVEALPEGGLRITLIWNQDEAWLRLITTGLNEKDALRIAESVRASAKPIL